MKTFVAPKLTEEQSLSTLTLGQSYLTSGASNDV